MIDKLADIAVNYFSIHSPFFFFFHVYNWKYGKYCDYRTLRARFRGDFETTLTLKLFLITEDFRSFCFTFPFFYIDDILS